MAFTGNSFKLLKACNFCRKRKIRCTLAANQTICESCRDHNRECVFDHKVIYQNKRQRPEPDLDVSTRAGIKGRQPVVETLQTKHNYDNESKPKVSSFNVENKDSNQNDDHHSAPPVDQLHHRHKSIYGHVGATGILKINSISTNKNLSSSTGTFLDQIDSFALEQYNKSIYHDNYPDTRTRTISYDSKNSLKDLYINHIEPYTPFLSHDLFEGEMTSFATCCINVSSVSSLTNRLPESAIDSFLSMIHNELELLEWSILNLSCFFLLPIRTLIPKDIIQRSLIAFNEMYGKIDLPINLVAGALCVDAWTSLFNDTLLITDPSISKKCCEIFDTIDIKDFNYQFVSCNIFLYKLLWLKTVNMSYEDKKNELIKFEFNMLLFPAKLSKNLIVVKDTLLSTPEAFILHILHNMLMIAYYTYAVTVPEIGEMTSIMPVPGLYHFISGMAISNFRVTEEIVGRWSIIADSQILTAKLLIQLYNVMEFDTFTFTLQFYTRRQNTNFNVIDYSEVDEQVKKIIANSVRDRDDDFDGAVVFWVFRDVRSMSLQLYINERRRRGSETSDLTL